MTRLPLLLAMVVALSACTLDRSGAFVPASIFDDEMDAGEDATTTAPPPDAAPARDADRDAGTDAGAMGMDAAGDGGVLDASVPGEDGGLPAPDAAPGCPPRPLPPRTIGATDPLPFGHLDAPVEGSTVDGDTFLSGWVLDDLGVVWVQARLDGSFVGELTMGHPRPDVCGAFPGYPRCNGSGFRTVIDLEDMDDCPHALEIVAADVEGNVRTVYGIHVHGAD